MAALIADAGEPVTLYGHSAGCAIALRAASDLSVAELVLADPPYTPRGDDEEAAIAAFTEEARRIAELHGRGDHWGSAAHFLGSMGLPPGSVEGILQSDDGERMVECARTLPYDYAQLGDGMVPTELAAAVTAPTIVLAPEAMSQAGQQIAAASPNGRLVPVQAPTHAADPAEIAQKLFHELDSSPGGS